MKTIRVPADDSGFQEDKDLGKKLRLEELLPALEQKGKVRLDFSLVSYATQSFVHSLIGEALKRYGEDVLDRLEFHRCSQQLQSVIALVASYTLGGFEAPGEEEVEQSDAAIRKAAREAGRSTADDT